MKFFFPDSQDLVDPSFDFETEKRSINRIRQRDDLYAHEVFGTPAFDGLLVSKGIVDGYGGVSSRYSPGQRHRLLRLGAPEFFRVQGRKPPLPIMGDCGAFTYVKEEKPPYSVEELLEFYGECRFDYGLSLDHVILQFQPEWDAGGRKSRVPKGVARRRALTLQMAERFLKKHRSGRFQFEPLGVAQGWSPNSYAESVADLQKMGYRYIALGGMVPLKNHEILACLGEIQTVLRRTTRLHLLGVTRTEHIPEFAKFGVVSFDSTSPLRQAFKDDRNNYYALDRTFTAIRIPQVEGNLTVQRMVQSGKAKQETARVLEGNALDAMKRFDAGQLSVADTLDRLLAYEDFYSPDTNHRIEYQEVLEARPWESCVCDVCRVLGYHVIVFRGAERNRRRGFHNLWTFYRRVRRQLGLDLTEAA